MGVLFNFLIVNQFVLYYFSIYWTRTNLTLSAYKLACFLVLAILLFGRFFQCWMVYNILVKLNACKKSWINNLRSDASLDKNGRLIRITPLSVQINQQIRTSFSTSLSYLAQRFAFPKELF
uniref:Uncharacterized protein n=1 Tax=Meloidogyne enterolobii TaxID=390850 RepID=A0A6V7VQ78_MELEN|nr:unnamed protein product [Meloidogyne enterolobii]